jgi:hypothetical protein
VIHPSGAPDHRISPSIFEPFKNGIAYLTGGHHAKGVAALLLREFDPA